MTTVQNATKKTSVRKPRAMKPNKHAKAEIAKVESWMKGTKTVFSPEILERQAGVSFGPNKELQDLRKVLEYDDLTKQLEVERNRVQGFLQERSDYKRALGEHLHKPTTFSPEKLDDWAGLGKNTELDNMNDYYKALEGKGKGFNWKKAGKWALIGLGVAAIVGLTAWGIKKHKENKEAELNKQEPAPQLTPDPTAQPNPAVQPDATVQPDPIVTPVKPEPALQPVEPVEPTEPSLVDADGKMTVQKGDGPWHLAERYLADKFKNEPEKFANLPEKEQNKMIHKKMMEIVELYKKQLEAEGKKADVRFEERIIKGKKQTVVVPVIHPGQKIQVVEIFDEAA